MDSQENSYDQPVGCSRLVQKLQAKQVARIEQVADVSKKVLGYVRVSTMPRSVPSGPLPSPKALN